jgi:creatinine amidohydrolase
MRPYLLSETHWSTLKDSDIELAVLPWGATEAHNYHLPYTTDIIETERITADSAGRAVKKGAKLIVLPCLPFGVNTGQLDIKGTVNLTPSTQMSILKDIAFSLRSQGIRKLLIVNGHGGNDFRQMIRETGMLFPELFICTCNWYQAVENSDYFEKGGGHADEMETSLMLYLVPDLVLPMNKAGRGSAKKFRIKALNEKWAWAERKWSKVTDDTGVGDPSLATREKGEKYFNAVTEKISELMTELSKADINDLYC